MSEIIIGELSQVGLTVEQGPKQELIKEEASETSLTNVKSTEESSSSEPPRARAAATGKAVTRSKRFRHNWMLFDVFKDWLRPHENPEFATCIVCNRVIKAGKSELEKHAGARKHLQMLKGAQTMVILGQDSGSQDFNDISVETTALQVADPDSRLTDGVVHLTTAPLNAVGETRPSKVYEVGKPPYYLDPYSKVFVTKKAPHWRTMAIVNGVVTTADLNDYFGRYLLLLFYPQDFNKICSSELYALSDRIGDFRKLQTDIVACSVDSHLVHISWVKTPRVLGGLGVTEIPLLADPTQSIARDYGVLLKDKGHTLRAHFLIDKRGIIRHIQVNEPDLGRSVQDLLRTIEGVRFIDEKEEGFPADAGIPLDL